MRYAVNYAKLKKFSFRYKYFCYLENEERTGDAICQQKKVKMWTGQEYADPKYPYRLILCQVKRSHEKRFIRAMQRFSRIMEVSDHNYFNYCQNVFPSMLDNVVPYLDI